MALTVDDLEQIHNIIVEPVTKLIDEKLSNLYGCYDRANLRMNKIEERPAHNLGIWQTWTATAASLIAIFISIFRWNK